MRNIIGGPASRTSASGIASAKIRCEGADAGRDGGHQERPRARQAPSRAAEFAAGFGGRRRTRRATCGVCVLASVDIAPRSHREYHANCDAEPN